MGKNAKRKDFYMEIRKSPGRFLSIFFIVAMGVAFFSGIRSSEPSMRITGDSYFDDTNLMDIKTVCTLGITEDDVAALGEVEGVAKAEGAYSADFLTSVDDEEKVLHLMSISEDMNQPAVTEGRLPEKVGECLVDDEEGYQVGDVIKLKSGTDDPVSDTLSVDTLTVVGTGSSPCYISFNRGSTTIGSGSISAFVLVPEETFDLDVYTEAYIQVENAKEMMAYTDDYEDYIEEVMDRVEVVANERGSIRRQELVDDANAELDDARKELEDGRKEAQKKLDEAAEQIADAQEQLDSGKQQLEDGKQQIEEAKATLNSSQQELDASKEEYQAGVAKIAAGRSEYESGVADYEAGKTAAETQLQESRTQLETLASTIAEDEDTKTKLNSQIETLQSTITQAETQKTQLETQITQLEEAIAQMETAGTGTGTGDTGTNEAGMNTGDTGTNEAGTDTGDTGTNEAGTDTGDAATGTEDTDAGGNGAETGETGDYGDAGSQEDPATLLAQCQAALAVLDEQLVQLETGLQTAQTNAAMLDMKISMEKEAYASGTSELAAAEQSINEQLAGTAATLAQAKSELEAGEAALVGVPEQLAAGQEQIDSGWSEIQTQEDSLTEGEAEIAENEAKLEEAKQEYEDGKADAEAEIADGESKIADAEAEIADIPEAKCYIYDRSTLPEYSGYGENADRMRAIGKVFPVIFFLVAALISLTSMTRMVEEQRTAIGTMKALGYGKFSIASKYMGYALLATVGGSILGVLVGEKILPYIIIYAYGIMYHHLPEILVPYNWYYGLMASGIAIVCITAATFAACYKELSAQPAVLMRPPAPKNGKRVLLERIGIIWKHLNFSWKSTVRNLMRYKKRFFMTIFGIGGCMALMLVGFGLKDSIFEITQLQYTDIQVYKGIVYLQDNVTDEEKAELSEYLDDLDGVEQYMDTRMQSITLVNGKKERATVECVMKDTDRIPEYVQFRDRVSHEGYTLEDDGVILSEKTAKLLDVGVGDTIYIKDEENGNIPIKISHICENYMGHYVYFTPTYYEEVYGEAPEYNSILFKTPEDYTNEQVEDVGTDIIADEAVLSISYMHDIQEQLDDMLGSLNLVIIVLIVSAGMLAFVVLYNLNNINITERQRELATLKVLGFYDPEVGMYVYRENLLLTLIGAVVGAGLGKVLHRFIIETVEVDAAMFGRVINFSSYVYSLLFTLAFAVIVNAVMYFKLKKIDMVESLKSIE